MPISVVVGGQFGSEGKGKVALAIARETRASIVVRVGGTNSGHTAVDTAGTTWALRQLPVSVLAPSAMAVLPSGAIIDPEIFRSEVESLGLERQRVLVSPWATVISRADKEAETEEGLVARIGSTGSGTGAALVRRIRRQHGGQILAKDCRSLHDYLADTSHVMRQALNQNRRIIIEGSQGFGLSVLHGGYYPKATSRDTTAGAFLGESGLSPRDLDDIILVLRCHPIRVAGNSGPLKGETSWAAIAKKAGLPANYCELTTATKRVRRVGTFDAELVNRAIEVNNPSRIVLNHFDYVDAGVREHRFNERSRKFLAMIESSIGREIDRIGISPSKLINRTEVLGTRSSRTLKVVAPP
jgi:adenylosuccinate synthase